MQALPVSLLLSARSSAWGSLRFRALLAGIFIALPIYGEIGAIMTCAQWFLALSAFLLVVASKSRSLVGQLLDLSILTLCGLTGPFCIVLMPIAIFLAWRRGGPRPGLSVVALTAPSVVQVGALLMKDPNVRFYPVLGASPAFFLNLIASKVYIGTLLGRNALAIQPGFWASIFLLVAFVGGTAILVACFLKASCEMKLFILSANLLLAASIFSPMAGVRAGYSTWQVLAFMDASRYWFFPMLAFAWAILWCIQSRLPFARAVSVILLCVMCFGIVREWRQPVLRGMHFADDAKRFEAAPAGTTITIPEGTPGWNLLRSNASRAYRPRGLSPLSSLRTPDSIVMPHWTANREEFRAFSEYT